MGKARLVFCVSLTSSIHFACSLAVSVDRPSGLTLRLSNSSASWAVRPISVVQTGVKSAGWLKKKTQLSPDRKSTRLTPVTNAQLVCRLLLEKKKTHLLEQHTKHIIIQ